MKKTAVILLTVLSMAMPVRAFAAEASIPPVQQQEAKLPAPISVERKNIDGTEYLIKTYETTAQTEPSTLVEENFELDGYFFTHQTTDKKVNENSESKEISEEAKAESQSKSLEDVIR